MSYGPEEHINNSSEHVGRVYEPAVPSLVEACCETNSLWSKRTKYTRDRNVVVNQGR